MLQPRSRVSWHCCLSCVLSCWSESQDSDRNAFHFSTEWRRNCPTSRYRPCLSGTATHSLLRAPHGDLAQGLVGCSGSLGSRHAFHFYHAWSFVQRPRFRLHPVYSCVQDLNSGAVQAFMGLFCDYSRLCLLTQKVWETATRRPALHSAFCRDEVFSELRAQRQVASCARCARDVRPLNACARGVRRSNACFFPCLCLPLPVCGRLARSSSFNCRHSLTTSKTRAAYQTATKGAEPAGTGSLAVTLQPLGNIGAVRPCGHGTPECLCSVLIQPLPLQAEGACAPST